MTRNAVIVRSNLTTEVINLPESSLKVLQDAVDGLIQPVDFSDSVTMWVNEEGLLRSDFGLNLVASSLMAELGSESPIMGNAVFTGGADEDGNTLGLDLDSIKEIQILAESMKSYAESLGLELK